MMRAAHGLVALLAVAGSATAQVHGGPVRQDTGPVSEGSTNVGAGSGPVRQGSGSVHDSSSGPLSGNPVRGSVTGDVRSGPVSEITSGSVTSGQPVSGGGAVSESTAGAVTKDIDSPIRQGVAVPVHSFEPLQAQLRQVQPLPREEITEEEGAGTAEESVPAEAPDEGSAAEAAEPDSQPPEPSADQPSGEGELEDRPSQASQPVTGEEEAAEAEPPTGEAEQPPRSEAPIATEAEP